MAVWLNAGLLAAARYAARSAPVVPPIKNTDQDIAATGGFGAS